MPAAQKISSREGISGILNLRCGKASKKVGAKWKKKFGLLKQGTLHLFEGHDLQGNGQEESHTIYLSKYKECTHVTDKKGRKKPGFILVPCDTSYEQWIFTCDDIVEQEQWISELNSALSGNVITIINLDLDEVKVLSPALEHLSKTRPKQKGKRAPSKRPGTDQEGNGSPAHLQIGTTTVDSAKKPRSSDVASPNSPQAEGSRAKAFLRGIGVKFSNALGRPKSIAPKTPTSPEPGMEPGMGPAICLDPTTGFDPMISPVISEDRMSLSALLRTLQQVEAQSGIIDNKAAALRALFQGAAADSESLGQPAMEVERGLRDITNALEHLNLAEELQMKVKEEEETKKEEQRKIQAEKQKKQEDEKRRKEAEQRRRDEEEQEQQDEEDRIQEEKRLARANAEMKSSMEELRRAKEAGEEEEKMWQSEDEMASANTTPDDLPLAPESKDDSINDKVDNQEDDDAVASDPPSHEDEQLSSVNGKQLPAANPPVEDGEFKVDSLTEDKEMKQEEKLEKEEIMAVDNDECIVNGEDKQCPKEADVADHL